MNVRKCQCHLLLGSMLIEWLTKGQLRWGVEPLEIPGGCFQSAIFRDVLYVQSTVVIAWCRRGASQVAPPTVVRTYVQYKEYIRGSFYVLVPYTHSLNYRNWGNANHQADLLRQFLACSWPHLSAGEKRENTCWVLEHDLPSKPPGNYCGTRLSAMTRERWGCDLWACKFKFAAGKQFDPDHTKATPCHEVYDKKCSHYSSSPCINFQESTRPGWCYYYSCLVAMNLEEEWAPGASLTLSYLFDFKPQAWSLGCW